MLTTRKIVILLIMLIMLTSCNSRAMDYEQVGADKKLILRFSHVTGQETPKGLAANRFKELVEAASQGNIEVQVFPNSTLYSDKEELEALSRGEIQLIATATSKLSNIVPEAQLFDLPYLFSTLEDVRRLSNGPVGQRISQLIEEKGYKVLAIWDNGFKQMTNDHHPIHHLDDFSSLHFRIMSSGVLAKQFELLQAHSVALPFDELYFALEEGLIHGEENTISNISNRKLYATQKYLTKSDHGYLGYFVLANKEEWERIPDQTRRMLERNLREVTDWERELAFRIDEKEYELLRKRNDMQVYELNDKEKEEWVKALLPVYEWFIDHIDDAMVRDYARQVLQGKQASLQDE